MATGAIATLKPLVGAISAPKTTTTTAAAAAAARTTTIRGKCHLSLLLAPSYGKLPSSGSKCCCGHNSRLRRSRTSEERLRQVQCNAGEVSVSEASSTEETSAAAVEDDDAGNWLPVIPIEALPKGERRLVRQDGATVLLLWYKNDVYAIENTSPAEGAYSEGLVNARLTPVVLLFILFSPLPPLLHAWFASRPSIQLWWWLQSCSFSIQVKRIDDWLAPLYLF